jgi:hypothetical protein
METVKKHIYYKNHNVARRTQDVKNQGVLQSRKKAWTVKIAAGVKTWIYGNKCTVFILCTGGKATHSTT